MGMTGQQMTMATTGRELPGSQKEHHTKLDSKFQPEFQIEACSNYRRREDRILNDLNLPSKRFLNLRTEQ